MRRILLCGLLLIPLTLHAQPKWQVEAASVTFEIKNAGFLVEGTFEGLDADVRFDPARPERSRIAATVNAATVESGIGLRNRHLRKRDYFDVARYPHIRMESVQIEKTGDDDFKGHFRLQIKAVTQEVTVPFTFARHGHEGRLAGHFTLNRLDFGLGEPSRILSDTVTVRLAVEVTHPQ